MTEPQLHQEVAGARTDVPAAARRPRGVLIGVLAGVAALVVVGAVVGGIFLMNTLRAEQYAAAVEEINTLRDQAAVTETQADHAELLLGLRAQDADDVADRLESIAAAPTPVLSAKVTGDLATSLAKMRKAIEAIGVDEDLSDDQLALRDALVGDNEGKSRDWIAVTVEEAIRITGESTTPVPFAPVEVDDESMRAAELARDEAGEQLEAAETRMEAAQSRLDELDDALGAALPALEEAAAELAGQAEQLQTDYPRATTALAALPGTVVLTGDVLDAPGFLVDIKTGRIVVLDPTLSVDSVEDRDSVRTVALSRVLLEYATTGTQVIAEHDAVVAAEAAAAAEEAAAAEAAASGSGGYVSPSTGAWVSTGGNYSTPSGGGGSVYVPPTGGGSTGGGDTGVGGSTPYVPPPAQCPPQPPNTFWGGSTGNGCPIWVPYGSGGVDEW